VELAQVKEVTVTGGVVRAWLDGGRGIIFETPDAATVGVAVSAAVATLHPPGLHTR
jgi:hypothetical protein